MKITGWTIFKLAFAASAGYEAGRILPRVIVRLAEKKTIQDIKMQYKHRMEEDRRSRLKTVPNDK